MRGRERPIHLLYLAVFGLAGWALLVSARVAAAPAGGADLAPVAVPLVLFFVVVAGARAMAFRLLGDTVVSLDSAFYIAATSCLGSMRAGWLVAIALTVDAAWRAATNDASGSHTVAAPPSPLDGPAGGSAGSPAGASPAGSTVARIDSPGARALYVLYFGGMSGALLWLVARLLRIDTAFAGATLPLQGHPMLATEALWRVPAFGLLFLALHYLLQGGQLWLAGFPAGDVLGKRPLRGMLAEAALLPLATAIVLIYSPANLLPFALLGSTYLLVNYAFNRLSAAEHKMRQRVVELETLNRTARALATTLQLHELIETLARETVSAIPGVAVLSVSLWDDKQSLYVMDIYRPERNEFQRLTVPRGTGISAWVAQHRKPLLIPDVRKARDRVDFGEGGDPAIRSWLGVPLVMYDAVIGVLSVQSHERGAFGPDHLRLLEAIGGQAAVAIQNARLYELATVDGLTGLYVRRYFDARLKEEWRRSARFETPFALVILDIDDFKCLNDRYGHPVGDRVLRETATVVKRAMRGVDIAARYGGEEFAFILPRTGMVDAHAVAERIRSDVADHRVALEEQVLRLTVSLGVAAFPESGGGDAAALLYRADVALYRAKATGKNRVEIYWPTEDAEAARSAPGLPKVAAEDAAAEAEPEAAPALLPPPGAVVSASKG